MNRPVAVVTGVGPGTGSAIVRRLAAGGYAVGMLARNRERLASLEKNVQHTRAYACDVSDEAEVDASLAALQRDMGSPSVLVHNAVGGAWGTFQDIDPKILNRNFQINTMALLYLAQRLTPAMVERGSGAIAVTGNTSALRGRANFAGFAPTKAAQRILAEAMARELGPKGIHVAYIVIDAVIDLAWTRERYPDAPDGFFIKPAYFYQGIGRYSPTAAYARGLADLQVLANCVPASGYVHGAKPTSIDAAIYGFIANIYFLEIDTPLKKFVVAASGLVRHCTTIHGTIG